MVVVFARLKKDSTKRFLLGVLTTCLLLLLTRQPVYAYNPPTGIPNPAKYFNSFDPIEAKCPSEPSPWNTDIPHWYYVNNQAPNASDGGNGNRVVPRKTIPTNLQPGDVVIIDGGPYKERLSFSNLRGTWKNPIWIRGTSAKTKPKIEIPGDSNGEPDVKITNCSYVIFENIEFNGSSRIPTTDNVFAGVLYINENSDHLVFRHIDIKDYPQPAACNLGRAAVSVQFTSGWEPGDVNQYHVFYDVRITNYQTEWPPPCEDGSQGIVIIDGVDHVWILDSYFYHLGEDGIHIIGLHGRHNVAEKRGPHNGLPNFIYIGNNEFYQLGENAVDVKESNHVIISHNKMHHFRPTEEYGWPHGYGAKGNAIAVNDEGSQNAGGDESADNTWILFNNIYDAAIGIFDQSGHPTYVVGNIIHDLVPSEYAQSTAIWMSKVNNTLPYCNTYVVNNTIYNIPYGINITNTYDLYSANNIVSNLTGEPKYHFRVINVHGAKDVRNELFFDSGTVKNTGFTCINCVEGDPMFEDPDNGDFSLSSGSPAIDSGCSSEVYSLFYNLYGLSIMRDITGIERPQNGKFDIGAYEFTSGGFSLPSSPSNLRIN